MAEVYPQAADDQSELTDLRQVDGGHGRESVAALETEDDREDADPSDDQHDDGHQEGLADGADRGDRNLHAEAHEKERDEKVSDVLDLAVELCTVREGRQRHAGDQGCQLHGQPDEGQRGEAAHEEAPSEGDDEHQLDGSRSEDEYRRHHELRIAQGHHDEHRDEPEGLEQFEGLGFREVGLDGEDHDGPDVLEDQNADRQPPGRGVHLGEFCEELHHDHGRGEAAGHADVNGGILTSSPTQAEGLQAHEEPGHNARAQWEREQACQDHNPPHLEELGDVELKADHEEHEDHAQGAELRDLLLAFYDVEADGSDEHAAEQVPEDERQLQEVHQEGDEAGAGQAEGNVDQQHRGFAAQHAVLSVRFRLAVARVAQMCGPGDQHEDNATERDRVDHSLLDPGHRQGAAQDHGNVRRGLQGVSHRSPAVLVVVAVAV
mmetsp:Transcript_159759/g.512693  ORF Transcript_159759/g.512693 Transcript_159759/m.512693 type:complete len:434 (-) Transcript_159759:509-1810(-)